MNLKSEPGHGMVQGVERHDQQTENHDKEYDLWMETGRKYTIQVSRFRMHSMSTCTLVVIIYNVVQAEALYTKSTGVLA
jgi:hypothetical protein